jgi:transmembrane sensor
MQKNTDNNAFISFLEDETFVQRIKTSENPEGLLTKLQKENPDRKDSVRYAFEFVQVNRSNMTEMDPEAYSRNLEIILTKLKKKSSSHFFRIIPLYYRISAVILVFLSIGSLILFHQVAKKGTLSGFAKTQVVDHGQAMIVLSDGSTQILKDDGSTIDYKSTDGKVVVRNNQQEEQIENRSKEKETVLNQVVIPFGQRHKILLSDGTQVQLNAGSKLTFPAIFSGKTREVYLTGEAFFEVTKNPEVPFIVKTDYLNIKVLGTAFNVTAYQDEQYTTAVLVEGRVNVAQTGMVNKEYILAPGQGCIYSNVDKSTQVRNVDIDDYVLWKDGLYNFRNMPLRDLVSRVRKYYNVPVQIEGEELANTNVTGKLVFSNDLNKVMIYLAKTMEGNFDITEEGVYILKQ